MMMIIFSTKAPLEMKIIIICHFRNFGYKIEKLARNHFIYWFTTICCMHFIYIKKAIQIDFLKFLLPMSTGWFLVSGFCAVLNGNLDVTEYMHNAQFEVEVVNRGPTAK